MFTLARRLASLRVSDVMNSRVVSVRADASMDAAAGVLHENHISGAPVVNTAGDCVGILSASDFVRRACRQGGAAIPEIDERRESLRDLEWGGDWSPPGQGIEDCVGLYMAPAVQGIASDATLLEAAQIMCGAHVHRLPILSPQGELSGMITSLDIVAALSNAIAESQQG